MKVFIDDVIVNGEVKGQLYIESDTYGFTVKQYSGTRYDNTLKREVEVSTTLANFMTVKGCCNYILKMKIKESTATTLGELLKDVERIEAYIESKVTV